MFELLLAVCTNHRTALSPHLVPLAARRAQDACTCQPLQSALTQLLQHLTEPIMPDLQVPRAATIGALVSCR